MKMKFKVGDNVIVVASQEDGVIKSINAVLGDGENLYEVLIGDVIRLYKEEYLELCSTNKVVAVESQIKNVSFSEFVLSMQIEEEIKNIFSTLDLKVSSDVMVQLANVCKIQKFMAMRCESLEDIYCDSATIFVDELYRGLIKKENNCFANSYTVSELLKRLGMKVLNVGMCDENGAFYVTNLVEINDLFYYFDSTLEKKIFRDSQNQDSFVLCSAGIGSKRYEIYYRPLVVIDFDLNCCGDLPVNISENDLDIKVVNRMIGVEI